jgi:acetoin utilization deacetylase AcuC-like enzyme
MKIWKTPASRLHTVPAGFPEIPERLEWAEEACRDGGFAVSFPRPEDLSGVGAAGAIGTVHRDNRLARLREAAVPWRARIDTPDCPVSPGTPEAAIAALATVLFALSEAAGPAAGAESAGPPGSAAPPGIGRTSLALIRPPGHHATPTLAMGFCYFNNVAIAARQAQRLGRRRVAILDFDVHHGNGTQEVFYEDGDVFFCSLHEDPRMQYPGTGFADERGRAAGEGKTLNLPFVTGTAGSAYLRAFEAEALPALADHRPEILLVSAGFDSHRADPLGGLDLAGDDFRRLGRSLADCVAPFRIPALFVLEGGYDPLCFSDGLLPFVEGWLAGG